MYNSIFHVHDSTCKAVFVYIFVWFFFIVLVQTKLIWWIVETFFFKQKRHRLQCRHKSPTSTVVVDDNRTKVKPILSTNWSLHWLDVPIQPWFPHTIPVKRHGNTIRLRTHGRIRTPPCTYVRTYTWHCVLRYFTIQIINIKQDECILTFLSSEENSI